MRALIGLVALLAACGRAAPSSGFQLARAPARRPVVGSGSAGLPPLVMDPMVLADASGYHLFYSTLFCRRPSGALSYAWDPRRPKACDIERAVSAIGYAYSADRGLTWSFRGTPVLAPAERGWDSGKVETAFALKVGGELELFYSAFGSVGGRPLPNRYQIGAASLDLGGRPIQDVLLDGREAFSRRREEPVLPLDASRTSFFNNVQEPSVVYRRGRYELYFIGMGLARPGEPPCQGDSARCGGQRLTQYGLGRAVLDADFRIVSIATAPIPGTRWEFNMPEVRFAGGRYLMVSAAFGSGAVHGGESVQFSSSADGLHWSAPSPALPQGEGGFDGWAATAPTVVVDGERRVVFYSAFGTDGGGPCDPRRRWGIDVPGAGVRGRAACVYVTLGRAISAGPSGDGEHRLE